MPGRKPNIKNKQETQNNLEDITLQDPTQMSKPYDVINDGDFGKELVKQIPKPGRTLIVKSNKDEQLNLSIFDKLIGLSNKSEINQYNSVFLTFDSIKNSEDAHNLLSKDYNVKYSYYKIFFTLSININSTNYENTKNELSSFIENTTGSTMLYCKFYRKNLTYMNCGDLVVDTIDAMKKLISKESNLKQFKTNELTGTFYRFNNSKYKTQSNNEIV